MLMVGKSILPAIYHRQDPDQTADDPSGDIHTGSKQPVINALLPVHAGKHPVIRIAALAVEFERVFHVFSFRRSQ